MFDWVNPRIEKRKQKKNNNKFIPFSHNPEHNPYSLLRMNNNGEDSLCENCCSHTHTQ